MARDGSGNYSIPNTFTAGTVIASSAVNANFSDIATALTGSVARDGQAPMSGVLPLDVTGFVYAVDPDTGIKRTGANEQAIFCGGGNIIVITTATVSISAAININGTLSALTGNWTNGGTIGGTVTITNAGTGFVGAEIISTDAGATAGPALNLYRNSASPAISDLLAQLVWYGKDSGGNKTAYGQQFFQITDPTNGTCDANWNLQAIVNGSLTTIMSSSGAQIQVPGSMAVTGALSVGGNNVANKQPTYQYLIVTGAGTYNTPAGCKMVRFRYCGAGGGGGAAVTNNGTNGGDTTVNGVVAKGGTGGPNGAVTQQGGAGGTGGSGAAGLRIAGGDGGGSINVANAPNIGIGGSNPFGGAGACGAVSAGSAGKSNSGGGGGGGHSGTSVSGGGGGAGEYVELVVTSPAATIAFTLGDGGAGGTSGSGNGGKGGSAVIIAEEYY